jgi:fructosamine-3-kinase
MKSRLTVAAPLAWFMAALLWSGCGGDIRADELSRSIDTLVSSAGEGRLVAQDVAEDRTKTTFVRVRARELGETVDHESEKLADATADAAEAPEKRAAVALADRISTVLGQLQVEPSDESTARLAARELGRLRNRCESLQGSL